MSVSPYAGARRAHGGVHGVRGGRARGGGRREDKGLQAIIEKLNALGGANGIGIIDIVENRLVGMKDRGVYETPGGTILYFAHEQLEMLTRRTRRPAHVKSQAGRGLRRPHLQRQVVLPAAGGADRLCQKERTSTCTGSVKLKLYKGNMIPAGTTSPYSLYSEELVTFGESDFDQSQACRRLHQHLWGLPTKVQALRRTRARCNK